MVEQSVLITGCSKGGIGHALALEYHSRGLRVFATSRRLDSMAELTKRGITTFELDVCDAEAVARMVAHISELNEGKLDILVNNAGQSYTLPATDCQLPRVMKLFDVNVFAVIMMCQAFIPLLRASSHPDGAKIVNIGSVVGVIPQPFGAAYNASKAAVHAYGDTLRIELEPFGIKVITIVTGGVKSNITLNNPTELPKNSLYDMMRDLFVAKRQGSSQRGAMDTVEYASKVVSATLKRKPAAWVWVGSFTTRVWLIHTFTWNTVWDRVFRRRLGLDIFKRRLATVVGK